MIYDIRSPNRPPPTLLQRINPFWWMSDIERNRNWPWLLWFIRNPMCNFHNVIIGIAHKERKVSYARGVGWTYVDGFNWGYVQATDGWLKRPFISYRGSWFETMLGWKTSGSFGYAFRSAKAPNATEHP